MIMSGDINSVQPGLRYHESTGERGKQADDTEGSVAEVVFEAGDLRSQHLIKVSRTRELQKAETCWGGWHCCPVGEEMLRRKGTWRGYLRTGKSV